jgi:hypothetical protein
LVRHDIVWAKVSVNPLPSGEINDHFHGLISLLLMNYAIGGR